MPYQGTGEVNGISMRFLIPKYKHVSYCLRSKKMHEKVEKDSSVEIS